MDEAKIPDTNGWSAIDIFLFSNGQQNSPPRKYHLHADELNYWDATLTYLGRSQYGPMSSKINLYNLDGEIIENPLYLKNGASYVAVAVPDAFIAAGYDQYLLKASRSWEKRQSRNINNLEILNPDEMKLSRNQHGLDTIKGAFTRTITNQKQQKILLKSEINTNGKKYCCQQKSSIKRVETNRTNTLKRDSLKKNNIAPNKKSPVKNKIPSSREKLIKQNIKNMTKSGAKSNTLIPEKAEVIKETNVTSEIISNNNSPCPENNNNANTTTVDKQEVLPTSKHSSFDEIETVCRPKLESSILKTDELPSELVSVETVPLILNNDEIISKGTSIFNIPEKKELTVNTIRLIKDNPNATNVNVDKESQNESFPDYPIENKADRQDIEGNALINFTIKVEPEVIQNTSKERFSYLTLLNETGNLEAQIELKGNINFNGVKYLKKNNIEMDVLGKCTCTNYFLSNDITNVDENSHKDSIKYAVLILPNEKVDENHRLEHKNDIVDTSQTKEKETEKVLAHQKPELFENSTPIIKEIPDNVTIKSTDRKTPTLDDVEAVKKNNQNVIPTLKVDDGERTDEKFTKIVHSKDSKKDMIDAYTQTNWDDVLLELRSHEDGHCTLHLPALDFIKHL